MKNRKDHPKPLDCLTNNSCRALVSRRGEKIACEPNDKDCYAAKFLQAESSEFHDKPLIEATKKIQRILDSIPKDSQGRKPSLLISKFGILLAWVYHGSRPEGDYSVTMKSDDATLIEALKLKL